ncbi:hypothetical protein ABXN37_11940 [Piscinibacter sakaiensis]|uniref:hypothetical protein n=1 Tax=Piscinibacter sakaiensis TaxID=1547922 RepID=UPI00372BE12F
MACAISADGPIDEVGGSSARVRYIANSEISRAGRFQPRSRQWRASRCQNSAWKPGSSAK